MTTTFRARCLRCGSLYDCNPSDPYLPETCGNCFSKVTDLLDRDDVARSFHRAVMRYRKGCEQHPTWRALLAAFPEDSGAPLGSPPF